MGLQLLNPLSSLMIVHDSLEQHLGQLAPRLLQPEPFLPSSVSRFASDITTSLTMKALKILPFLVLVSFFRQMAWT